MSNTNHNIQDLVKIYHDLEANTGKGPLFTKCMYAIEPVMDTNAISSRMIFEWFGAPDLWAGDNINADWIYFFDHRHAGESKSEWMLFFRDSKLYQSGFNLRGINDRSQFDTKEDFVAEFK